jgi:Tfp pilus assembly protein PilX
MGMRLSYQFKYLLVMKTPLNTDFSMKWSFRPKKDARFQQSLGFTLVMTLSLLVLLTMIAVGVLSLSTVTLRSSGQSLARTEAQANARVALMMAIGQLQRQLGPDQRISITADQRTNATGDGGLTTSALGNRQWTGVYDAWSAAVTTRPTPTFRSWLISADAARASSVATANTALTAANDVELVGTGTLGTGTTGQIRVPSMNLSAGSAVTGRLAWWTGDQGVKAALITQPTSTETSLGAVRGRQQSAPRNTAELAAVGAIKPFTGVAANDPRMQYVTDWNQAGFLVSDPKSPSPLFHDLAASSSGLLTNVRSGGFRKDLSFKMENFTEPPDLSSPGGPSSSPNVLYYVQGEEGINMQELWSYYQLYKQMQYGGGGSFTSGGTIPGTAPYLRTADSIVGVTQDSWDRYKQPITISYQVVLSFEMRPAPKDPGRQALFVNMDPIITLWNPLDVAVDVAPHQDPQGRTKCWMYVFWVIPYDINVQVNGGMLRNCSLMRSVYNKDFANTNLGIDYNMLRLNAGEMERITLKPGEVLKISQTGNTVAGNGGFTGLNGTKGFNYGGGTRFALLDNAGQYILLDPADQISYSTSPNNLTGGVDGSSGGNIIAGFSQQNSRRWSMSHISTVMGSPWGTNTHIGQVSVDHCYGYSRPKVGEVRTTGNPRMNKTLANSTRVFASDPKFAEAYPIIQGMQSTRVIPANSIAARKAPFMVHSYDIKTEMENKRGTRTFARFNPKAHNVDFYNMSDEERDLLPYQTGITPLTSWLNAPLDESTNGQGFFGSSLSSQFGSSFVNTHSVPRQPILSLAAFQDSFANGFNKLTESVGTEHAMARMPLLPQISHAIGNSLAPSLIAPDKTEGNLANNPRPLADHSFLANRALWDDWFLSGIAPQPIPAFAQNRTQRVVATDFFSGTRPLPVARYMPVLGTQTATQLVTSFFSGTVPNDTAINNVASYLRCDGMFNVNSTSVEAWKTLLGALKGQQIVVRDENGVESIAARDSNTPVAGVGSARNIITMDSAAMRTDQWFGRRTLTDVEIDLLAKALVREIRKRGPFISLADFVNRRVGTNKPLARSGAIQSALDANDVTINKNQNTGRAVSGAVTGRFAFPEAEAGPLSYGAPGVVKQADILTPIAPVLSARSDSFIIRAHGVALDRSGNVTARAWCEAVVERDRNYIDLADRSEAATVSLTRVVNRAFGRRFVIKSFRWLNAAEI